MWLSDMFVDVWYICHVAYILFMYIVANENSFIH